MRVHRAQGGSCMMRICGSDAFAAYGLLHGGGTSPEAAGQSMVPLMMLQAGGDAPLGPIWATIGKMASIKAECVLRTYWDQNHGWSGGSSRRRDCHSAAPPSHFSRCLRWIRKPRRRCTSSRCLRRWGASKMTVSPTGRRLREPRRRCAAERRGGRSAGHHHRILQADARPAAAADAPRL